MLKSGPSALDVELGKMVAVVVQPHTFGVPHVVEASDVLGAAQPSHKAAGGGRLYNFPAEGLGTARIVAAARQRGGTDAQLVVRVRCARQATP
jgi:hypothetical protein